MYKSNVKNLFNNNKYVTSISQKSNIDTTISTLLVTSLIAAFTIGGKALGKGFAVNQSEQIVTRVSKIINILVENKIVKAHRRQWNSKLRRQGRVGNGRPNNSLNLPEEKAKLIFDYYKQNITYVKIAELLDLTYLQVNNFIE